MNELEKIRLRIRQFAADRDWDQFHSPKNLSMALAAESGELLEQFQWLTEEQSKKLSSEKLHNIKEELADIQIYLIRLADKLNIDIIDVVHKKIEVNEKKYPADKVKGSAKKYDEYK